MSLTEYHVNLLGQAQDNMRQWVVGIDAIFAGEVEITRDAALSALETLKANDTMQETLVECFVHAARSSGATWDQIGRALGTQRQVVWRKYKDRAV